jgi:hypothetical protein
MRSSIWIGLLSLGALSKWRDASARPSALEAPAVPLRSMTVKANANIGELIDVEGLSDSTIAVIGDRGHIVAIIPWRTGALMRIGSEGDGPGAFRSAAFLARTPTGELLVVDRIASRVSRWGRDKRWTQGKAFPQYFVDGAWAASGALLLRTHSNTSTTVQVVEMSRLDDSMRLRFRVPTASNPSADSTCRFCFSAAGRDGRIAMSASDTSYTILQFDVSGRPMQPIRRRDIAAVMTTAAERDSIAEYRADAVRRAAAVIGRPPPPGVAAEFVRAAASVSRKPRFIGFTFGDDNRLWVQRHVQAHSLATVDVFASDGRFIGVVTFPAGTILRRAYGNRALTWLQLDNGDYFIAEWTIGVPTE